MNLAKSTSWMVLAVMIMAGPIASAQKIKTSSNPDYNLAPLKKFAFAPLNPNDPLRSHPALAQRIKDDLKVQLEKIGMQEDDAHADVLVAYSANKQTYTSTYGTSASPWTSGSEVWTTDYTVGTLVVDLLDPKTKQPFWGGTATETVYSGTVEKYLPKGVEKLIQAFQKDIEKQRKKAHKG